MKTKQDNYVTEQIGAIYAKNETKLLWSIDWVWFVTKTRYDNEVTKRIGAINTENDIELSWPIVSGVVYEEN